MTKVEQLVSQAWGVQMKATVKQRSAQQPEGSNDCAVFVLRNMKREMARVLGLPFVEGGAEWAGVTRDWLLGCWEARADDDLPLHLVPEKVAPKKKHAQPAAVAKKSSKGPAKKVKSESRRTQAG